MSKEAMKLALEAAYLAGFNASGEGYNGEYPFQDHNAHPAQDEGWCQNRDAYIREALAEQPAPMIRGDIRDGLVDDEPAQQEPVQQGILARKWILHGSFADVASFDSDGVPSFYGKESVAKFQKGQLSEPCKGKNCGSFNGWLHSAECRAEHEAQYTTPQPPAQQEPVDFASLLREAEEIVREKPTWKRFIDGTPLANDIAVWMTVFAQDVARRASPPASKPLTDDPLQGAVDWLLEADGEYFCTATVQRTLRIGYNRAKRLCDTAKERAAHGIKGDT